jgi:ATP-dependent exoDNAse (exonuclease V) beta subunit
MAINKNISSKESNQPCPSLPDSEDFSPQDKRLASDPATAPGALLKLSEKDSPELLERVAENVQTPPRTLEKLAEHESSEVRSAVTENPNTPHDTMRSLASDENPDVRFRLAENPQTPANVLETLAKEDENPYVVARAQETLNKMKSVAEQADEMLLNEQFGEAEQLYRKLTAGLEELLGPQHNEVGQAMHKLAAALGGQGKEEEAQATERHATLISAAHKES